MHLRITINLGRRRLQNARFDALGEAQHVERAMDAGLGRLDRIELVVHRRRRAGQVEDAFDLYVERKGDVVAQQLEHRVREQVLNVALGAGEVVVDAQHVVTTGQEPLAQMRTDETRPTAHHGLVQGACSIAGTSRCVEIQMGRWARHSCSNERHPSVSYPIVGPH